MFRCRTQRSLIALDVLSKLKLKMVLLENFGRITQMSKLHGNTKQKDKMPGTILIYGGAGGIGAATARCLKSQRYHLHLVGRDESKLCSLASELDAGMTVGDVLDDTLFARATAAAIASNAGQLAGLIYAVGTINLKPFARLNDSDFIHDFRVNALSAAKSVRAAQNALKAYEGTAAILLFSTIAVTQGFTAHASIAMAKGAVEGLTLSLAAELAPKIRVNAIAPSLTRTPLTKHLTSNEQMSASIAALHPLQRLGEPEDVGNLAAFLASQQSGWITGQIFGVDGGRSTLRTKG